MARPSPRTQGCAEYDENGKCIKPFQKFGTQQLKFIDPTKPALGVKEVDVGESFKGFTTTIFPTSGLTTAFSEQFQSGITGVQKLYSPEVATQMQKDKLESMGIPSWQFPDLTTLFPPASPNGNGTGCECEACKNGTGVCSDKRAECNAWDIGCELFGLPNGNGNGNGKDCGWFGEKCWGNGNGNGKDCGWFGEKCWFDPPDLGWVKWVLVAIGIGVLLWLLRPLFGIAKNITGN